MKFEVQGGSFGYPGGGPLLQGLSFSVQSPEILAVLGPNGAGKTTLLRCLLGLLPWRGGRTLLNDRPLSELGPKALWRAVGYVPQQKRPALSCTVLEMVLLGRSAHLSLLAQPSAQDEALAWECLKKAGVEKLAHRPCGQLSGGEYQLVLFARALAVQPRFLVLDEPEANLNLKNQQRVLDALARLCRQEGLGALWITHSPQNALALADKALLLGPQGGYRFGPAGQVLTEENLRWSLGLSLRLCRVEEGWCVLPVREQDTQEKGR